MPTRFKLNQYNRKINCKNAVDVFTVSTNKNKWICKRFDFVDVTL